ncbi:phage tail tube protein [Amycolatopsis sp. CFH S0078]|uniref:phage tail tube protein n=1 Tax=Amycolatopsis sp. CFH S0078 TaxID=1644108 RepID=UPI00106EA18C|nr:phage tail tube protein [Amycolatopsis sp. CFH S0078]
MTYLSRLATLGLAKEVTQGAYVPPTVSVPFTKASFDDDIAQIKDESVRGNDVVLQGLYQGVWHSQWNIDTWFYPDIAGHFLRGMIGPDTVTPGISTTLSSASLVGATTVSTTASIAANSYVQIDTGQNLEYAKVTAVSGIGPYTLTVTGATGSGLTLAHASGVAVVSQTSHSFKQNRTFSTVWPTYSLTVNDGVETRGWPGCVISDLQIKIDPKGAVSFSPKLLGWPGATQSSWTYGASKVAPFLGWQWQMNNGGAVSTRGLSYDMTLKRATEAIHASMAQQGPREIFPGAIDVSGAYKAIYENQLDLNLYLQATQSPTTATITQPIGAGAQSLTLTTSQSGYTKGQVDLGSTYVQASFDLAAINNTTDTGALQATLLNFQTAAY